MEESIISVMIDYGTLGITCGVLFWLHIQNTKRNDVLISRFQEQIEKLRTQAKKEEQEIRDRWMAVVEKYDSEREAFVDERTQLRSNLAGQMREISKDIITIKSRIDGISVSQETQSNLIKNLAAEARLKELAQAAAKKNQEST